MGRHSRKGAAPSVEDTGRQAAAGRTAGPTPPQAATQAPASAPAPAPGTGRRRRAPGAGQETTAGYGTAGYASGAYGTPAHGTPRHGTPAHGTPVHVTPGTPAHGIPVYGTSPVRGGHPQHDEAGAPRLSAYGGHGTHRRTPSSPRDTQDTQGTPFLPGPRRELRTDADALDGLDAPVEETAEEPAGRVLKGRTLTGIAAAAVTTVLAVVVAGQVADRPTASSGATRAADRPAERASGDTSASRSDDRDAPAKPSAAPSASASASAAAPKPTYEQLMTRQFPIDPKLKGSGEFEAVPGFQKAPGKGRLVRYRIDVEKGIGLDPVLFASAVQKTLNDERSWAGQGAMAFERISSGNPEFVITLASPGTTGAWCAKSGLDTTVDNVSCDSASTERVMINAFRWAQGSETFGPKAMYAYRQMLINHEVGHRLGHGHVSCDTPGALAPVMQQQTKSLKVNGIQCRPNPWVYPGS
ncbi:DUF3152 domain-containing protein [Streptomyces sp. NPDC056144]|uniref:DUF3152 domain-containing protein n=1 Tax=unclassified Streptomyces TaxID=2593676 RepID=UPI0035D8178E